MYDLLTTTELTELQNVLYEATEQAYYIATCKPDDPYWTGLYRPFHREIALLFLDVGGELVRRLDQQILVA
jgi:hypothetical protein